MLQQPDLNKRFAAEGIEPLGSSPEQFAAHIKTEIGRWAQVVKAANVKLD